MGRKALAEEDTEKEWKKIRKTLLGMGLCDRCLGRQFHALYPGKGNASIGTGIRKEDISKNAPREMRGKAHMPKECPCCMGLFSRIEEAIGICTEISASYEFKTFVVGCTLSQELLLQEERVWEEVGIKYGESIKKDINREIGLELQQQNGKEIEFARPDIIFICDFTHPKIKVRLQVGPAYAYGEYQKLAKIPQTKWFCRECRGRGCKKCGGTGLEYQESVEMFIANPGLEMSGASSEKFHGAGREDIDVKMLGWRPFVLELQEPIKRKLDYTKLEKKVNKDAKGAIKVRGMRESSKREMVMLKTSKHDKTYELTVKCKAKVSADKLEEIESMFTNKVIEQQTPLRVSHRRADKIRKRAVRSIRCKKIDDKTFKVIARCESGLYIKELASGGGNRTHPCFVDAVGPCECIELNVLEVHL